MNTASELLRRVNSAAPKVHPPCPVGACNGSGWIRIRPGIRKAFKRCECGGAE